MIYDVPPAVPQHLRNPDDEDGLWIDGARLAVLRRQDKEPTFGVKDLAMTFFAKSGSWLRMRSQPPKDPEPGTQAARHPMGWFTVWGDIWTPLKINRVKGKDDTYEFRRFTLQDAELMLWSFWEHEVADAVNYFTGIVQTGKRGEHRMARYQQMVSDAEHHLNTGLQVVKWIGRLHGVTPMPVVETWTIADPIGLAEEFNALSAVLSTHSGTGICTLAPDRPHADVGLCRACVEQGLFNDLMAEGEPDVAEDSGAEEAPGN